MWIRLLYSCVLALASPFFLYSLYKKKPGKPTFGPRWKEHWGITPKVDAENPIWIHAVSVGESIAAMPIINALKERDPHTSIVVTTTTSTGAEQIDKLGDKVIHRYMPLDFAWCVKGFLQAVKPSQMLIIETELWPNTLHQVAKHGIPITVVNARLSERSCLRYQKFQRVFDMLASNIHTILCQYQSDAERFLRLGVRSEKLVVTGSVKFDVRLTDEIKRAGLELRYALDASRPVWIAASTHEGEDSIVIDAHKRLLQQQPTSLLVLVPRHPERFDSVTQLCRDAGLNTIRRTEKKALNTTTQVYVADTMGEMMTLIGAADVCFMGGSLLGNKVGGHNYIEPAAHGKPCLTGPSYFNFAEIAQQLIQVGALKVVDDAETMSECLITLLLSPEKRQHIGNQALTVVKQNQGALEKTLNEIYRQKTQ